MPYKATDQQRQFQAQWMWRRRMTWILDNGPCVRCGSSQDLRVVYKDPAEKTVRVTAIWSRKEEDREQLLSKCVVLCRTCALDKLHEERQPQHGTDGRYNQGCRCDPCKGGKAAAMRRYRARKKEKLRVAKSEV